MYLKFNIIRAFKLRELLCFRTELLPLSKEYKKNKLLCIYEKNHCTRNKKQLKASKQKFKSENKETPLSSKKNEHRRDIFLNKYDFNRKAFAYCTKNALTKSQYNTFGIL